MTFNEFMAESQESQVDIVSDKGILLAYRNEGVVMYDLYGIDEFYVEFSYNLANNEAVKMKIYQDPMELKPYLQKNDLSETFISNSSVRAKSNTKLSIDEGPVLGEWSDG